MTASTLNIAWLSHLSWDRGLLQRPQQLALRFAASGDTVSYFSVERFRTYIETPLVRRVQHPAPRLEAVMLPQVPGAWRHRAARALTDALVALKARGALSLGRPRILWLQHPRFATVAEKLEHDLLVYDCMDPHAEFRHTDPRTVELEDVLLRRAHLVFAGGRSIAALLRPRRANIIELPSGVELDHFTRATAVGPVPEDLARLQRPVLGYVGAVDERIDWPLVEFLARERPHWSIVFIGPVLGDSAPKRLPDNVRLLGARDYGRLPDYLRGLSVCLLPWVVNRLTAGMSPTKVPEYLATGRPVVCSAIPDVVADHGALVRTASTPAEFLEHCTAALVAGLGTPQRSPGVRTWDELAAEMRGHVLAKSAASGA